MTSPSYTWEVINADFVYPPYEHQLEELETHALKRARALFWTMRTGKTKVIVDEACMAFEFRKAIDTVIILAPNGVHLNWQSREIPRHHWPSIQHDTWAWRTDLKDDPGHWAQFEKAVTGRGLSWFMFSAATVTRKDVKAAIKRILKDRRSVMIVADESHDYRVPGAKRSQYARHLSQKCTMRRILSGTPLDNSPLHAFSQFELLKKGALGFTTFEEFEKRYAEYERVTTREGNSFPKLKEFRNLDELTEKLAQFASVVTREDCKDLPDIVPIVREVGITDEQRRVYEKLKHEFLLDLESGEVSVGEKTSKLIKMQQVLSGFVKDEFGDVHDIVPDADNPRLAAVVDEVNLTGGRCIVWCAFRPDMDKVVAALRADGHEVMQYHGRTSETDKAKVRKDFEPGSHGVSHLVGHPVSGGSGLDLSAADKIVWYSHTFDAIVRTQADERATAIGGKNIPVVDFIAGPTDSYVRGNVRTKVSIADAVSREGLKEVLRRGL